VYTFNHIEIMIINKGKNGNLKCTFMWKKFPPYFLTMTKIRVDKYRHVDGKFCCAGKYSAITLSIYM